MTNEAHPEGARALFQMTQDLHWNTPLISRSRADITRLFDGFTLVEPERPRDDPGAARHLCGIGIKP